MTHAERRLREQIDVMTDAMDRLGDYIGRLEQNLMPVARALAEFGDSGLSQVMGNDEAADYVGCEPGTLRVWVSKRVVPHLKIGRLVRFRRKDLDKWLDRQLVKPDPF